MICDICNKPVVLVPSAKERAKKYGGKPSDYVRLFPRHAACQLERDRQQVRELMRKGGDA